MTSLLIRLNCLIILSKTVFMFERRNYYVLFCPKQLVASDISVLAISFSVGTEGC